MQHNTPKLVGYALALSKPALTVGKGTVSIILGVPFPLLWGLSVALVDFLLMIGGIFGGLVAALLAIPTAGALQVPVKEVWQATAPGEPQEPPAPAAEPATKAPAALALGALAAVHWFHEWLRGRCSG